MTDSALKTADAGYLTRRLVDVAHDVIIRQGDCGVEDGVVVDMSKRDNETYITSMLLGRVVMKDLVSKKDKKTIVKKGAEIDYAALAKIVKDETITEVTVRSPLFCRLRYGLCAVCYGWDLSA